MTAVLLGLLLLAYPVSSPSLVEQGDAAFAAINYVLAESMYKSALAVSTDSSDVLWRLARVYVCAADVAPHDEKLLLYRLAEEYARRSIAADSMRSEGHTWQAAALGNIAMFEGSRSKVRLCNEIKKELDCSIRLNPGDDIAYSILGSFYQALGNVSWIERQLATAFFGALPEGGYDEAEAALKKAIALAPNVIRHHCELGDLYMRQDRNVEALAEFQSVMSLPVLLASDRQAQLSAVDLIKELSEE